MFSNYFFLKRLAEALKAKLEALELIECYSQNKDELVIGFANDEKEFWIKANLDPNISLVSFPDSIARAKRNSVDLFAGLKGKTVKDCSAYKYDRSFQILFDDDTSLIFKMHGRWANILLAKDAKVVELFRNNLTQDLDLNPSELHKDIEVNEEIFREEGYQPTQLIPALGKEFQTFWDKETEHLDDSKKWPLFEELLSQLESNPIFLDESKSQISLLESGGVSSDDPIEAANWLNAKKSRRFYFEREKEQVQNKLNQQIKKSENYIFKTSEKLRVVQSQRNPEEIANILMANLSLIEKGLSKVVLSDFYTNDFIEIKLNPKLSAQKNAENLYRKSKNRHQEIKAFETNINEKEKLISSLKKQIDQLNEIDNAKDLKRFVEANKIEKAGSEKAAKEAPYHTFEKDDWLILVGKNAKANDELTLKVATKNDLWLHAKDVSGSHVVIKQKPGQNFPNHIIEYAASLAAFNSKRKSDSLCPVIYTPKKFVRKPKGSAPGSVIVEKEEVIMVEPLREL